MIEAEFQIVVRKSLSKFIETFLARSGSQVGILEVCLFVKLEIRACPSLPSQSILQTTSLYSLSRMLECYIVSQYLPSPPLP